MCPDSDSSRTNPKKVTGINQCQDGRWRAYITKDGQRAYLGRFDTREEAIRARKEGEAVYGIPIKGPVRAKSKILLDREIAFVEIISPLVEDAWAIIDAEDVMKAYNVRWRLWGGQHVYNKIGYLHRLVLDAQGNPLDIDHIDRNPLNNRKQNLRLCTHSENCRNLPTPKRGSSGVHGVNYNRQTGRWVANITREKKRKYLGSFRTREEAIAVRRAAERGTNHVS